MPLSHTEEEIPYDTSARDRREAEREEERAQRRGLHGVVMGAGIGRRPTNFPGGLTQLANLYQRGSVSITVCQKVRRELKRVRLARHEALGGWEREELERERRREREAARV